MFFQINKTLFFKPRAVVTVFKHTPRFFCVMLLLLSTTIFCKAAPYGKILPVKLHCELRANPLGIDVGNPDLSFVLNVLNKADRGLRQTAYQIIVASSPALLQKDNGDLWNSGKVASDKMAYIKYEGRPLQSSKKYWWKVRVWDNAGSPSSWSAVATWTMGMLQPEDWKASWLTARGAEKFSLSPFGYRAATAETQTTKWIQIDLQQPMPFDQIRVTPMFFEDRAGYGFPSNFKIEASTSATFENATMIADYTTAGFSNPGWKPVTFTCTTARSNFFSTANSLRKTMDE